MWHRLLPFIAQRPVMARWNRDAESIYMHQKPIKPMLLRGARPLKANLYLIRLKNKKSSHHSSLRKTLALAEFPFFF